MNLVLISVRRLQAETRRKRRAMGWNEILCRIIRQTDPQLKVTGLTDDDRINLKAITELHASR